MRVCLVPRSAEIYPSDLTSRICLLTAQVQSSTVRQGEVRTADRTEGSGRPIGWLALSLTQSQRERPTDRLVDSTRRRDSSSLLGLRRVSPVFSFKGTLKDRRSFICLCVFCVTYQAQSLDLVSPPEPHGTSRHCLEWSEVGWLTKSSGWAFFFALFSDSPISHPSSPKSLVGVWGIFPREKFHGP